MAKNLNTKSASSTPKTSRKPRAKSGESVQMCHAEALISGTDEVDALLAELSAELEVETVIEPDSPPVTSAADDEIVLDAIANLEMPDAEQDTPVESSCLAEDVLEAAVGAAEAVDAQLAIASPEGAEDPAAVPSTGEGKTKRTPTPRKHYSDKVERLKDRVGESLAEYTVLTTADAMVDEAELGAVMERTLEIIRSMNSKEKNRASNFIEFLSGKKAKLNNVLERVLKVLERDGFIQTGAEGNVIQDLLARPYSMASARAMGGNTIGMYADLKVILPDGKGKFIANPDSLLLAKARALLAVPAAAA